MTSLKELVPLLDWLAEQAEQERLVLNGIVVHQVWVQLSFESEPVLQFVDKFWHTIRWMSVLETRVAFSDLLEGVKV